MSIAYCNFNYVYSSRVANKCFIVTARFRYMHLLHILCILCVNEYTSVYFHVLRFYTTRISFSYFNVFQRNERPQSSENILITYIFFLRLIRGNDHDEQLLLKIHL